MNSEPLSSENTVDLTIIRQAIVTRTHSLWGSEISVLGAGNREQLDAACSQALQRINPRQNTPQAAHQTARQRFLKITQADVMNDLLIKDIIQVAQALEKQGQCLTLSIYNPLDAFPDPIARRAMVRQLYKLKDQASIELAYNTYTLDTQPGDLLADLKLYDYIKMPFPDSAIRLSLNAHTDLLNRIYDHMLEAINTARVCFIADHIEFADSAILARNLPFEYFQGSYYSPADRL